MAFDEARLARLTYQRKQASRWRLDELVKLADLEIGNLMIAQADEHAASKAAPIGRTAPKRQTAAPADITGSGTITMPKSKGSN